MILIVGATIAVFLACIPYDFYRFRKRKKKVRDHQERLSLVTRIAPGHAKVVLETVSSNQNQMGYTSGRRFGFKSLFSVFRFVGGKMRASHGHIDATNPVCADENNIDGDGHPEKQSATEATSDSSGAKASYVFSQQVSPACPTADDVDLCPFADDNGFDSIGPEVEGEMSLITEDGESRPRSSSPLVLDSNNGHEQMVPVKKGFHMFKKANEIFNRDSDSRRHASNITSTKTSSTNVCETLLSEPATVEVTSINKTMLLGAEDQPQDETPTSKVSSPASSTSSPEVALLRKSCPKVEQIRTFHYPTGKSSVAYHSMPTISDIP